MSAALWLIAGLYGATLSSPAELRVSPLLSQHALLFLSDDVSAGGIGGGLGAQFVYRDLYLAQVDVSVLFGLGNAVATRLALGVQRPRAWSPAGFLTIGMLTGDRVEFLSDEGARPALPTWSMGVRAAPLRFASELGVVTALEPGIATDYRGGLWFELTMLQVGLFL